MYKQRPDGSFAVTSRTDPKKVYTVNEKITHCDCPKFKYILKGQSDCHHMTEVREGEQIKEKAKIIDPKFEQFKPDKYTEPLDLYNFTDKYGDEQLDSLLALNVVIIQHYKVRLLK